MSAPDRCYWLRTDDGEDILIPMCMGTAVNGPQLCTCDVPESQVEEAVRRRDEAERQVMRLREARDRRLEEQASIWRRIKRLETHIRELERQLAQNPHTPPDDA